MKYMKLFLKFLAVCMLSVFPTLYAGAEGAEDSQDLYEYNNLIAGLETNGTPQITKRYVVFTHKTGPRF